MNPDVRVLEADQIRSAHTLFAATIHRGPVDDQRWTHSAATYSPGRTLGIHHGSALVATATSIPSELVVPGGAVLPMAAVTRVGVRADHTRRGLLTAMMRAQLDDVAARGEPVATLRASEARIYGRFGYGVATRGQDLQVNAERAGWRSGAPLGGSVRLLDRDEILPTMRDVHAALALNRVGSITRPDRWWQSMFGHRIDDREPVLGVVHTGAGGDDGFAIAFRTSAAGFTEQTLEIADLQAADVQATAGLWRFLLGVDLITSVHTELRPLDEPLELLLGDPRACVVTGQRDETWLRLVDVPAALAARSYGPADPVLLAVHDPLLEKNAGVYRIADGSAELIGPLGGPVAPELECNAAALAMAYLGDRTPSQLVATGWWSAPDPGAVRRADAAFAAAEVPWCGTFF
ncbi:GNAT family N-acetyltransferase [Pseudonocardia yunnanensis]|uniref:GNAT family N-acetyltransferase n=1 Tax=Pseudonocardia yunnanensis TaxID=58107 RepID=A0ABW4EYW5_9PSEU